MIEEVDKDEGLETTVIAANSRWIDVIGMTLYDNRLPFPVRLGFGHTPRKVDLVVMGKATKEDEDALKLEAMKGKEISD